jgi:hypothetical protein
VNGPRILTLDIENSPSLSWHFGKWGVNIPPQQNVEPARVLSFGMKWDHEKKVRHYSEFEDGHEGVILAAHAALDAADVVITYNGDRHDLPWLDWEFTIAGMKDPSPFKSVDLYKTIRKYGDAPFSKKLGYITKRLHLTGKLEHEGYWPIWMAIRHGSPEEQAKAWRTLTRYCKQDVFTTDELRWFLDHKLTYPNVALFEENITDRLACPRGHTDFQKRGYRLTTTRRYQRFQCNVCGKFFSDTRSSGSVSTS